MPYISKSDLIAVIPQRQLDQLTDDTPDDDTDTESVDAVINAALNRASSRIDSYLAARYSVPLRSVPPAVQEAAEVLAKRWLYFRRNIPDPSIEDAYKAQIAWLQAIAEGRASVPELEKGVTKEVDDTSSHGLAGGALFSGGLFGR